MKEGGPSFCLGNPPHLVGKEEAVCRQCGILAQGTLIGFYQVKRFLGSDRGNQSYLAASDGQTQPVLMKLFLPDPMSQHLWEHAWQEMHLLAGLQRRAILPVLNCTVWKPGTPLSTGSVEEPLSTVDRSLSFLVVVYQYAPVTLQHLILTKAPASQQNAKITVERLMNIIEQMASALILAHSLGAVHGALEPGNVLLNAQLDQVWIADFGLARLQLPRAPYLAPELVSASRLCEQRRDMAPYWEAITEASDQYTLAVICYQLFLHAVPPALFQQRILPVLQHALQAEPAARFPRIGDFSNALAAACEVNQPFLHESDPTMRLGLAQEIQEGRANSPLASAGASSLTPAQQIDQLEQLAGKYFTARDYQAASQAYLQASLLDASRISALAGLADTYFALERYPEALEAYSKVLDLDPGNAEAWFNQATVFDLLGRSEQATRAYERAEQLRAEAARRQK